MEHSEIFEKVADIASDVLGINADEITESIALDTDLKTWANASAWSLEDGKAVEIASSLLLRWKTSSISRSMMRNSKQSIL